MVEIARAPPQSKPVLIMDEQTSSLTRRRRGIVRITRNLREEGTAIAFISHRLEELFAIADRVTTLRDARYRYA